MGSDPSGTSPLLSAAAFAFGAAAVPFFLVALKGLPRGGESPRVSRIPLEGIFPIVLAVLSIALLAFMPLARDPLSRIEPFSESRALLEWTCAFVHVLAVSPVVALAAAFARGCPVREGLARPLLVASMGSSLRRFLWSLPAMLTLQVCILLGARAIGSPVAVQPILIEFVGAAVAVRLPLAFLLVVVAPFAEEAVFRGSLHPLLSRVAGPGPSRVATSVLFGILHGGYAAIPTALLGYFLARVRDVDGRLLPAVVIHGLYNALMLGIYVFVPPVRELFQSP